MNHEEYSTLARNLAILLEKSQKSPSLTITEILKILSGKGRSLILIFLSLPFCQPIQIPGFSTPFGIVIAFIGLRIAFGKHLWLPKRLLLKTISSTTIQKIAQKFLHMIQKFRKFIRPRLIWLCKHRALQIPNGLLLFLLGIFLALPLPIPLTNFAAGLSIFLVSLGLLEDDGFFVLIGYLASLLTLMFFILILFSMRIVFYTESNSKIGVFRSRRTDFELGEAVAEPASYWTLDKGEAKAV